MPEVDVEVRRAVEKLRPYRNLYRNAVSALTEYARAYQALGASIHDFTDPKLNFDRTADAYGVTRRHIQQLHQRAIDAMYSDVEDMVRQDLGDRDCVEGPVSEAKAIFLREENQHFNST